MRGYSFIPQLHPSCVYRSFHKGRKGGHTGSAGIHLFISTILFTKDRCTKCFIYPHELQTMTWNLDYSWNVQCGWWNVIIVMHFSKILLLDPNCVFVLFCELWESILLALLHVWLILAVLMCFFTNPYLILNTRMNLYFVSLLNFE